MLMKKAKLNYYDSDKSNDNTKIENEIKAIESCIEKEAFEFIEISKNDTKKFVFVLCFLMTFNLTMMAYSFESVTITLSVLLGNIFALYLISKDYLKKQNKYKEIINNKEMINKIHKLNYVNALKSLLFVLLNVGVFLLLDRNRDIIQVSEDPDNSVFSALATFFMFTILLGVHCTKLSCNKFIADGYINHKISDLTKCKNKLT